MALQLKPHSVTVVEADEQPDAFGTVSQTGYEGGVARRVQVTPMPSGVAFERFGLEAERPHLLLDDPDGEPLYRVGNRVLLGARVFQVARPPMLWDAEPTTSCVEVALVEVTEGGA